MTASDMTLDIGFGVPRSGSQRGPRRPSRLAAPDGRRLGTHKSALMECSANPKRLPTCALAAHVSGWGAHIRQEGARGDSLCDSSYLAPPHCEFTADAG
jgi:hypothetical protein